MSVPWLDADMYLHEMENWKYSISFGPVRLVTSRENTGEHQLPASSCMQNRMPTPRFLN